MLLCIFKDKTVHRVNRQLGEQVELRHVGVAPKLKLHQEDESERPLDFLCSSLNGVNKLD